MILMIVGGVGNGVSGWHSCRSKVVSTTQKLDYESKMHFGLVVQSQDQPRCYRRGGEVAGVQWICLGIVA